jgi:SAM-dependent methyltransferase
LNLIFIMNATLPPRKIPPNPVPFEEQLKGLHWTHLDTVYTAARREIERRQEWRFGPARVHEVAKEAFDAIAPFSSPVRNVYCDLGCGTYHPHGVASVMFMNGADATVALDLKAGDARRAAEALADLVIECLARPEHWHWSAVSREEFLTRARRFDLDALRAGELATGMAGLPMRHVVTDIHHPSLEVESIDLMASRAVLEHFLDFERAVERLYQLMRPGGVATHMIDIVDHRAYEGSDHHWWSFLTERESWSDGVTNRLRSCEIRPHFERVGFEVLSYRNATSPLPPGFRGRVAGRFRAMSDEELSVTGVSCVLRKPTW